MNQDTGKLNVNQENSGQVQYNSPQQGQYNYNQQPYGNGYNPYGGGMPPKKNNTNTIVIILASVLGVLLCVLIAVSVMFFAKSGKMVGTEVNPPLPADIQNEDKIELLADDNVTYVTCVSNAQVYVRSGASKSNSVVLTINGGDTSVKLKATGNTSLGSDGYEWYEVTIPSGQVAWVRSDVVTLDGPNPYQRPAEYQVTGKGNILVTRSYISDIYIRSGPGKNYPVVQVIQPGDTSVKLKQTGSWQYGPDGYVWYNIIRPNGQSAWVRSDIVTLDTYTGKTTPVKTVSVGSGSTLVTKSYKSQIYVRSGPSKSYSIVLTINPGDTSVKLVTTGSGQYDSSGYLWYQVKTPSGQTAWVRSDIVTTSYGTSNKYSTSSSSGNLVTKSYKSQIYVRNGPGKNYRILLTINPGDTSVKLRYTGSSSKGDDGYIWYNVITPSGADAWVRSDIVVFE